MRFLLLATAVLGMLLASSGCSLVLPEITHQPVIRNPFPQLSRVAVAPFFNQSDESTVDGRQIAMAYFAELQKTPGFEVVPVGVIEEAILAHRIDLAGPGEARRLAELLGVDAVVVGSVTDYSAYYPPRLGLRVEWYTANPGFHEIPAGYGLPWHTPEEEFIPDSLAYEAKMAMARAQLASQAPACFDKVQPLSAPAEHPEQTGILPPGSVTEIELTQATEELPAGKESLDSNSDDSEFGAELIAPGMTTTTTGSIDLDMPCAECTPSSPSQLSQPTCLPHNGPVLQHTRIYRGTDPEITEALRSYVYFREDARFGGWEAYLQRSDDFVRFCCHMHISEMLSARGGSRKTRVVWRWPESR